QFILEGVVPDLLHVIPVGHNPMLNWVLQGQNASLALGFITNITIFLTHSNHHTLVTGPSHDGGKHSPGSIIACKASLTHPRSIVDHQSCNIIISHGLKSADDVSHSVLL
ncbi:hypothetical protein OV760_29020, partial [Salmonella enterica subsp. enterica serovar 1,4,[5],12:i:-]|nr:hypothetical protein [Salmonella enterica subsp. enterica serovar 1,4,[5],12:i:-]